MIKKLVRRLPPIAKRDVKIRELQRRYAALREQAASGRTQPASGNQDRWAAAVALVRASGLFDEQWYQTQLHEPLAPGEDPVRHYLTTGYREGHSPHPAFAAEWYRHRGSGLRNNDVPPLLHYLQTGAARLRSPHPGVDAERYAERYPESLQHPGGPLGHLVERAQSQPDASTPPLPADEPWEHPQAFLAAATRVAQALRDSRGYLHLERDRADFDRAAEAQLKARLRDHPAGLGDRPLVSVVIPTKDRAGVLAPALDSVLAQTYPEWELLLVDDGSQDETPELLARYTDPRVKVLRHERPRGVAAARNTGLAHASGRLVAYLDSDNTWRPDFLELMVRFMVAEGHQVAYAMSELIEHEGEERRLYRGMPFHRAALAERNYIDCIVLVHERTLLETTGGFDETLRRNVDWDLFIRLARVSDFGFLPVIATEYDVWDTGGERITSEEAESFRFLVRQRTLVDWEQLRDETGRRDPHLTSVVIAATKGAESTLTAVRRLLETARGDVEVVVVDSNLPEVEATRLHFELLAEQRVTVHRMSQPLPLEVNRNVGASMTTGSHLVFAPETAWFEPGWDLALRTGLEQHVVVQPLVLTPGGSVWAAGTDFAPGTQPFPLFRDFPGDAPEVRGTRTVPAVPALCVAVRAEDYLAVQGFDPLYANDSLSPDLSLRLTADGRTAGCLGDAPLGLQNTSAPVKLARPRGARDNQRLLRAQHGDRIPGTEFHTSHPGYQVAGFTRPSIVTEPTPILVHDRSDRPLRWAIKIGAPTVELRSGWGDWHFAVALRDSLERLGQEVSIDCQHDWYRPTAHLDDVVLVLRGVAPYTVNPGHTNVAWVISHPERVSPAEVSDYDVVFGASERWCRRVAARVGHDIPLLMQCTDHRRFRPVQPDPVRQHDVLAVANARARARQPIRPSVAAALRGGVTPAVYGAEWQGLLPPGAWKGRYLPNDELPGVYAAAGVVLNDHWDDMREHGILSNRLFDLTACNARVVTDYLPEVQEVFGDVVLTYRNPDELAAMVDRHLHETPERRRAREELGERVRREHTFDARAAELLETVRARRAVAGRPNGRGTATSLL